MIFRPPWGEKLKERPSRLESDRRKTTAIKKSRFVKAKEGIEDLMEDMQGKIKHVDHQIEKINLPKSIIVSKENTIVQSNIPSRISPEKKGKLAESTRTPVR